MATRVASSRLIGRSGELAEVEAALEDAAAGSACVGLVGGESGVGKTRLLSGLAQPARDDGFLVLLGETVDFGARRRSGGRRHRRAGVAGAHARTARPWTGTQSRMGVAMLRLALALGRGDHVPTGRPSPRPGRAWTSCSPWSCPTRAGRSSPPRA